MSKVATDNSYSLVKAELRLRHLPDKEKVKVLDVFHGTGALWQYVKNHSDKKIEIVGIDKRKIDGVIQLPGDNLKYLSTMDLSVFDVLDLDAYGWPVKQLEAIWKNETRSPETLYYFTVVLIGSRTGGKLIPFAMLEQLGYTRKMIGKCKSVFMKNPFSKFEGYLANIGIGEVTYINIGDHWYGCFVL